MISAPPQTHILAVVGAPFEMEHYFSLGSATTAGATISLPLR